MKKVVLIVLCFALVLPLFAGGEQEDTAIVDTNASSTNQALWFEGSGQVRQYNTVAEFEAATGQTLSYNEAPQFAELVKEGKLPPVEERLPENPVIMMPANEIGVYGGTAVIPAHSSEWIDVEYMIEFQMTTEETGSDILPNVFFSTNVLDDAKRYEITLRKGLKWSDGVPLTTEDFQFWAESMAYNKEMYPEGLSKFKSNGKMMTYEIIDDYTFAIIFEESKPHFGLDFVRGWEKYYQPKHYLKNFHPEYIGEEEAQKLADENGYTNWTIYFEQYLMLSNFNPDYPVFNPYVLTSSSNNLAVFERNPYYFKVDAAGNQLPYINTIRVPITGDGEPYLLQGMGGEMDLAIDWQFGSSSNFGILKENESSGGYRLIPRVRGRRYPGAINLNYTSDNAAKRKIYNDVNFRRALALALDGEEINNVLYQGQYELTQTPLPDYYSETLSDFPYSEFNLDKANQMLDDLGLKWNADRTLRMFPDGTPMQLIALAENSKPNDVAMGEVYKTQLEKVGIELQLRPGGGELTQNRILDGDYDINLLYMGLDRGFPSFLYGSNHHYVPVAEKNSYAPDLNWGNWLVTSGMEGVEPPADVKKLWGLGMQFNKESDMDRMVAIQKEMAAINNENLWIIAPLSSPVNVPQVGYYYINDSLGNVPNPPMCAEIAYIGFETFYIK